MAVTLEWIRDNYDANRDRLIDDSESQNAVNDLHDKKITIVQLGAVLDAENNGTLLPAYTSTPSMHIIKIEMPSDGKLRVDGVEIV